ncbi:hypothetical protein Val02_13790 [Virgisporangium aliadipatigenens]|uniref:Uncharacterized protein n=1 Tax=Virgisporangium aliadipatigenens TaxID=741659 RepID=A0A8J3YHV3_9ACTN|nr:hypothetical protein [Virgisporangium aliadipatigenens]GIJ44493.1 hypothetical protein Val02_13790 [Virgisporangium aliadipatigenens]
MISQRAWRNAATRAGAPGGLRFTARQLYYELNRSRQPLYRIGRRPRFTLPPAVSENAFAAALARFGPPPGVVSPAPARSSTAPEPVDLYDYGLPRLLVCQDAEIAAMLRANELHMESACPVYALDDLPLDPRLGTALERGDGTVFVLHDASLAGLAAVAAAREAFPEATPVEPLGLRPAHAAALHLTRRRGEGGIPGAQARLWAPWERDWLARGNTAEVAAVPPARLLRTVHRLVRGFRKVRTVPRLRQLSAVGYLTWPEG